DGPPPARVVRPGPGLGPALGPDPGLDRHLDPAPAVDLGPVPAPGLIAEPVGPVTAASGADRRVVRPGSAVDRSRNGADCGSAGARASDPRRRPAPDRHLAPLRQLPGSLHLQPRGVGTRTSPRRSRHPASATWPAARPATAPC